MLVYVTTENVKLSYTHVEDVHTFIANFSPFILQNGKSLQFLTISTDLLATNLLCRLI